MSKSGYAAVPQDEERRPFIQRHSTTVMYEGECCSAGLILFVLGWFLTPICWIIGGFCIPAVTPSQLSWKRVNKIAAIISIVLSVIITVVMIILFAVGAFAVKDAAKNASPILSSPGRSTNAPMPTGFPTGFPPIPTGFPEPTGFPGWP
jgi:hypothetical protein